MGEFLPCPGDVEVVPAGLVLLHYTTEVEGVFRRIYELHHPTHGLIARQDPSDDTGTRSHADLTTLVDAIVDDEEKARA